MARDIKETRPEEELGRNRVSNSDESRLRDDTSRHESSEHRRFERVEESSLERDSVEHAAEEERLQRGRIQSGHTYHSRFTGKPARDDKSAEVFASFNPNERAVQLAEFWRYSDSEIEDSGYF